MDKPTDLSNAMASSDDGVGQAKIDANNKSDAKSSSLVGNTASSSCNLGCGPKTSSALNHSIVSTGTVKSTTTTTTRAKTMPSGASLPKVATTTSTLQQTAATTASMQRFVSTSTSTLAVPQQPINLNIKTTTGGNFDVVVDPNISVENLKKIVAKKLKVAKDRIRLLHRERELQDGLLKDNSLMDGSKIILIPNVETGLLAQRPENTVMQALESLNDSQVNDFLSGKTPLNLSMRLGDHMMLIQLQLSTVNPANGASSAGNTHSTNSTGCSSSRARTCCQRSTRSGSVSSNSSNAHHHHHSHHHHHHPHRQQQTNNATTNTVSASNSTSSLASASSTSSTSSSRISLSASSQASSLSTSTTSIGSSQSTTSQKHPAVLPSLMTKRNYESLQNIVRSIAMSQPSRLANLNGTNIISAAQSNGVSSNQSPNTQNTNTCTTPSVMPTKLLQNTSSSNEANLLEQSPIKSLSNLVTSSTVDIKNIPINTNGNNNVTSVSNTIKSETTTTTSISNGVQTVTPMITCQDPIAAKLTSCLCTRLNVKNCVQSTCNARQDIAMMNGVVPTQQRTAALSVTNCTAHGKPSSATNLSNNLPASAVLLHKTANNPIMRSKHRTHHNHNNHHHNHHYNHQNIAVVANSSKSSTLTNTTRTVTSASNGGLANISSVSNDSGFASDDSILGNGSSTSSNSKTTPVTTISTRSTAHAMEVDEASFNTSDTRTLAEASRNLTQTLRKLSKEVFTNKIDMASADDALRKAGSGAVIESMKNHGKGIYSGTFSGTLNPALQDRYGRPKRDISTVIHILNDLLSATPQYRRGARIGLELPSSNSNVSSSNASNSSLNNSRSKQMPSKHNGHLHNQNCLKCVKTQTLGQNANNSSNSNNTNNSNSNSNSAHCAYGECNGHYTTTVSNNSSSANSKTFASKTTQYACCSNQAHNASNSNNNHHHHNNTLDSNERNICSCRFHTVGNVETAEREREREHTCQKCLSEMENLRTKSKLDQLRFVMQQRKQKREARKLKSAPYGARVVATSSSNVIGSSTEVIETTTSATRIVNSTINAGSTATATATKSTITNTNINNNNNSSSNSSKTLTTAPPSEVSPNHIVEEVDTAA